MKVHEIYLDWQDVVLDELRLEDQMDFEQYEIMAVSDENDDHVEASFLCWVYHHY